VHNYVSRSYNFAIFVNEIGFKEEKKASLFSDDKS
jgi:hypothetical protein